jgi:hypothetical protein
MENLVNRPIEKGKGVNDEASLEVGSRCRSDGDDTGRDDRPGVGVARRPQSTVARRSLADLTREEKRLLEERRFFHGIFIPLSR